MLTQHVIDAMFVMSQTSIHGGITKKWLQIEVDSSTCVALAQHIIANIVMAILSADQHIPRHAEVTKTRPQFDDDLRYVTLAQHIVATIVMAILGAD